ncbi:hypothetical protein [Paracidovorax sp. MALMAid1276]|uniref:hypothetical protein n=1 Tax=Paracidovorax sp. MALMAid1276 TaxID=3411631 RepID=UPI003B9A15CA
MATPNYGYEKRQRELAKKQKKEDKLRAKAQRKPGDGDTDRHPADGQDEGNTAGPGEASGANGGD